MKAGLSIVETLTVKEQCALIYEILKLTAIGPTVADLRAIGGTQKSGIMLHSKMISKTDEFKLINQSVTGIYENAIDLLTI